VNDGEAPGAGAVDVHPQHGNAAPDGAPARSSRRRIALLVGLGVIVVLTAAVGVATLRPDAELPGIVREPAPVATGHTLLDHAAGDPPREIDLVADEGELLLVYFGYLSCPDVCPMTMGHIKRAQAELGPELADRTTVAFVTLDPERDDGQRLRTYLELFFDDRHLGLTAPDEPALVALTDQLGVRFEVEEHEPDDERYDVAHSAITYVVDDTGTVVRELPFGTTASDYARVVRALLP
jgi:protein SCO1